MKKNYLILSVVIGLFLLGIGYYLGNISGANQTSAENFIGNEEVDFSFNEGKTIINFTTEQPGFCQVLIGTKSGKYDQVAVESMPEGAHKDHYNAVEGLKPNTQYVYKINFSTADGKLSQSNERTFNTPESMVSKPNSTDSAKPIGLNIAALDNGGRIIDVSSNYGSAANNEMWGAELAIDEDSSTEWSSAGDGNVAWIEIGFDQSYKVSAVGFWTRTMGTSAEITEIQVTSSDGTELGTYPINGAEQIQYFEIEQPTATDSLRFEVIDSSGGNTGAVEIEVYTEE